MASVLRQSTAVNLHNSMATRRSHFPILYAVERTLTPSAVTSKMRVHARHGLAITMHIILCVRTLHMLPKVHTELRGITSWHIIDIRDPGRAGSPRVHASRKLAYQ